MSRFLSAFTTVASLAACTCAALSLARLTATERRLAKLEEASAAPATLPQRPDPEIARLRAELEELKSRPEPQPYYAVDPSPVEKAIREALARSTEPKPEESLEELAARAAVDGTVPRLSQELGLSEDQGRDLRALYREAALAEVALWRNATTEAAVAEAEKEAARVRETRDAAVRARLTIEQREKFDAWLNEESAALGRQPAPGE